jgi:DNA-binding NtrC family response regulator
MSEKILIVEDELLVAKDLKMILEDAGYTVCGIAASVPGGRKMIEQERPDLVILDIFLNGPQTGITLAKELNEENIPFIYLSANSNQQTIEEAKRTRPYGFMIKPFREEEVLISIEIARYRHQTSLETERHKEDLLRHQLEAIISSQTAPQKKMLTLISNLQPFLPFDLIEFTRPASSHNSAQWEAFRRIGFNEYQYIDSNGLANITAIGTDQLNTIRATDHPEISAAFYNGEHFTASLAHHPFKRIMADSFHLHAQIALPLLIDKGAPYLMSFYSKQKQVYHSGILQFLSRLQPDLINVLQDICAGLSATTEKTGFAPAAASSRQEEHTSIFPGIIGRSQSLLAVMDFVKQVSGVDTSVLILGETGTGKEKIADEIHHLSKRNGKPFVKVNCAAIPSGLLESELFGHEKGAFTGAINKRIGKFEQAHGGTIFLDEIGDVPLDVQVKLLRVLQQREVERIGGLQPVKIDVRVLAATNKNLEKEIAEGRFRLDLYYRLNVFPIWLPPLRKRVEDIPLLVRHFIQLYAGKHEKQVFDIAQPALEELMRHEWPGNIRELENSIERSIVLAAGQRIENVFIQAPHLQPSKTPVQQSVKSIDDVEREHILVILHKCNFKVYGPGGAADLLNIPPSTLASKMKKFGIMKDRQE